MVYGKGLRPVQVLSVILFVRILSVFLVQTWYVPDEYWQTLEVAHKQAFGYGALTWEWTRGLRSYLQPSIVAALYWLLNLTSLDHPLAVIFLPRILQAILSTYADYRFYKWTGERKWALFLILTSWFWFYNSGRTLLQSTETALATIALSLFPFKDGRMGYYEKESSAWLILACISILIRPTSAPLWVVFVIYSLINTNQGRLRLLVRTYVPIALLTAAPLIALDSYFHGSLLISPWEFFRFNVLYDIASFFGTHPWYWYLTHGLPATLGVNLLPVLWAVATVLRRPKENRTGLLLIAAAAVYLAVYSAIPHKEFRYCLPLIPIFLYLVQDLIVPWSRKAKKFVEDETNDDPNQQRSWKYYWTILTYKWQLYLLTSLIILGNAVPALYFGLIHQSGTTKVMSILRDTTNNQSSVLFLMPCHSTPLYSHLHKNITTRYLDCSPPPQGITYESAAFYNNPQRWWRAEYASKQPPTHVVLFDVLKGRVDNVLSGYRLAHELPHTQFPDGEVGEKVLVYQKVGQESQQRRSDDTL